MLEKFPTAIDIHKLTRHKVPNGLGIVYVLVSVSYLFLLHVLGIEGSLALGTCILFGGFLGLIDDFMISIPWKYKAFLPLIATIPLIALRQGTTTMATYIFGKINLGIWYYIIMIPIIVVIVTNSINMLDGLNGLSTIPPVIILIGLALVSKQSYLLLIPIFSLLLLVTGNFRGKFFLGNVGSFSIGLTIASFGIIANTEQFMALSLIPYIFNSVVILSSYFFLHEKAKLVLLQNGNLTSHKRRSLVTILSHNRKVTEKRLVIEVSFLVFFYVLMGIIVK